MQRVTQLVGRHTQQFVGISLLILVLCTTLIGFTAQAQAHVLQSNNGVSAVLHIEPADDPVAGEETIIGLEFNSTNPHFKLADYMLTATVQGTSVTSTQPPVTITSDNGGSPYVMSQVLFPDPGSYTLIIKGALYNPKGDTANQISNFSLTYEIRAERSQALQANNNSALLSDTGNNGFDSVVIGVATLGLLSILAQYKIRQGGRYDKNR